MRGWGIRQILRTPVRSALFLLLMALAVGALALGASLNSIAAGSMREIEASFETVATVQQKADSLATTSVYDAMTKTSRYRTVPAYDEIIPVSALEAEGCDYVIKPEKRPYYAAYSPELKVFKNDMEDYVRSNALIVEVTALEGGPADHSQSVRIDRVLFGDSNYKKDLLVCDHLNPSTGVLRKGSQYVMALQAGSFAHDEKGEKIPDAGGETFLNEYWMLPVICSTQYTKSGERIADDLKMYTTWDEVTEGFFDTPRGKRWEAVGEAMFMDAFTFPVIPTQDTSLLMVFYDNSASITSGSDISDEEYAGGERVCLISDDFASFNGLSVGDSIELPLYYADYSGSPGDFYPEPDLGSAQINFIEGLLNAKGEAYTPFEKQRYRIAGTYCVSGSSAYALGRNAVIIPSASVRASDENNIVAYGPMNAFSTSFRIKNGGIEEFTQAWNAAGIGGLEIAFYDNGYSEIASGLRGMERLSSVLLVCGVIMTLLVCVFFAYMFISRQKKRVATERSLGMTKRSCAASLLGGVVIVALTGALIGSALGFGFSQSAAASVTEQAETFDTAYSAWTDAAAKTTPVKAPDAAAAVIVWLGAGAFACAISAVFVKRTLDKSVMLLLEKKDD